MSSGGYITLIIGPMFSGKTTELIRLINRAQIAGKKCLTIKYKKDTRYGSGISTHDLLKYNECVECDDLLNIEKTININDYDIIAIDEGSFIKNIQLVDKWANNGRIIYISAIDSDFQRNPFVSIVNLIPKAENIIKLTAICNCGEEASFTKRITDSKDVEIIGGSDMYRAVCRTCL